MGELLVTANHYFGGVTVAKIVIAKNDYYRESKKSKYGQSCAYLLLSFTPN